MKKILLIAIVFFICGKAFSQIYAPINPTIYGTKNNRSKDLLATGIPSKEDLLTNTNDLGPQIFYYEVDSTIWAWSEARGFFQVGGGVGVVDDSIFVGGLIDTITFPAHPTKRGIIVPVSILDSLKHQYIDTGVSMTDGYVLTWDNPTRTWVLAAGSGGSQNLQQTTDVGNVTTRVVRMREVNFTGPSPQIKFNIDSASKIINTGFGGTIGFNESNGDLFLSPTAISATGGVAATFGTANLLVKSDGSVHFPGYGGGFYTATPVLSLGVDITGKIVTSTVVSGSGFIPLAGTSVGQPVTGPIMINGVTSGTPQVEIFRISDLNSNDFRTRFLSDRDNVEFRIRAEVPSSGNASQLEMEGTGIKLRVRDSGDSVYVGVNTGGLYGSRYFGDTYADESFTQKHYVDSAIAAGGGGGGTMQDAFDNSVTETDNPIIDIDGSVLNINDGGNNYLEIDPSLGNTILRTPAGKTLRLSDDDGNILLLYDGSNTINLSSGIIYTSPTHTFNVTSEFKVTDGTNNMLYINPSTGTSRLLSKDMTGGGNQGDFQSIVTGGGSTVEVKSDFNGGATNSTLEGTSASGSSYWSMTTDDGTDLSSLLLTVGADAQFELKSSDGSNEVKVKGIPSGVSGFPTLYLGVENIPFVFKGVDATTTDLNGVDIYMIGGNGNGTGNGGNIFLGAGTAGASSAPAGNVAITAGVGSAGDSNGGTVTFNGGAAAGPGNNDGGDIILNGGSATGLGANGSIIMNSNIEFAGGANMLFETSTGTKIGTSTSEKLSFYGSTPIVQPTGSIKTALTNLGLVGSPTLLGAELTMSDVTTNDVSTSQHGFAPKATNIATDYLSGTGAWNTPLNAALNAYALIGGTIKGEPLSGNLSLITQVSALADQSVRFTLIYLPKAATITGVKWYQGTQGNYTASNYNGLAIYSISGGTLTIIDSSANNGNMWKGTASTWQTTAFTQTHALAAGVYVLGYLYCRSGETTAPTIGAFPTSIGTAETGDFTNSVKLNGVLINQVTVPLSKAMSLISASGNSYYGGVY